MTETDKAVRLAHLENTRAIDAVLDGILVYKRPDTDLYRVMIREFEIEGAFYGNKPETHWTELFWNNYTGEHWSGEPRNDSKSIGDETYVTWEAAPYALRKLALDLRLAAIP